MSRRAKPIRPAIKPRNPVARQLAQPQFKAKASRGKKAYIRKLKHARPPASEP